jgi:uncharacterized protein (TIGR02266 family)
MSPSAREKRAVPRIQPFVIRCQLHHGARVLAAYVTDLSARGARLSCDADPPAVGSEVEIDVRFRGHHGLCRLRAEVKWVRPQGGGAPHSMGVRFAGATSAARALIEKVVGEFQEKASRLS